jgi:hypothetical protein
LSKQVVGVCLEQEAAMRHDASAERPFTGAAIDVTRRIECACGAHLRTYALPFGDLRGSFRAVCRVCGKRWEVPFHDVLAGADGERPTTFRLASMHPGALESSPRLASTAD